MGLSSYLVKLSFGDKLCSMTPIFSSSAMMLIVSNMVLPVWLIPTTYRHLTVPFCSPMKDNHRENDGRS